MTLLSLRDVHHGFGGDPLLDGVDLRIEAGERVCLVGRNGTGKSTLLKIINGQITPDDGLVTRRQALCVAELGQEVPAGETGTVFSVVSSGLGELGELIVAYHSASVRVSHGELDALDAMGRLQHELESAGGWEIEQRVETVLSRLELDGDAVFGDLSGGMKRRVMLARALVQAPDLLLLDEPTNHLDVESIDWLETFLSNFGGALLFITHDRAFLRRLATRIVELDRGSLTSWPGNFDAYEQRKTQALEAEAKHNAEFDRKLAQEEVWIRQGIKARRTRNEGRVRALEKMRAERRARRQRLGTANMRIADGERSGKIVVETTDLCYAWGSTPIADRLSTMIMRGDRIGIIGPNGCGKSTLLQLLLGQLEPQSGTVRQGTNLEIAYFDQLRSQLDGDATVRDTVAQGSDKVTIGGQSRHVISYLQDFLFTPQRARSPVRSLSGGERNRLLLARLFLRPANLLIMDEPTNDLDVETLELLEELLQGYDGTLLLVSHDREFLDNVVTSTLVFEGDGRIGDYVGGYRDWLRQRSATDTAGDPSKPARLSKLAGNAQQSDAQRKRKLSYKEQQELDALPGRIETLENEQESLHQRMAEPTFYQGDGVVVSQAKQRLSELADELEVAYARWESLDKG